MLEPFRTIVPTCPALATSFQACQPVLDPFRRAAQGNRIDQRVRHRGGGLVLLAVEIEVLDRFGLAFEPHLDDHVVVEILRRARPSRRYTAPVPGRIASRHAATSGPSLARTNGAVSKPSIVLPAFLRPSRVGPVTTSGRIGREEDRQVAVGDLSGHAQAGRGDRGGVERHIRIAVRDAAQRSPQTGRVRPVVGDGILVAVELQRLLARQDLLDDRDVFPGALHRFAERHAVPALDDLRAGRPDRRRGNDCPTAPATTAPSSPRRPGCGRASA